MQYSYYVVLVLCQSAFLHIRWQKLKSRKGDQRDELVFVDNGFLSKVRKLQRLEFFNISQMPNTCSHTHEPKSWLEVILSNFG